MSEDNENEEEVEGATAGVSSEDQHPEEDDSDIEWQPPGDEPGSGPRSCIMTVVALLALTCVAGAFLVPNFIRARSRGQLTACKSNLKNIGTAYEMYSTDWSGQYPSTIDKLTPNYLKTIPECPSAGSITYSAMVGQAANNNPGFKDYYYVECHGANHTAVSVKANYPAYDGITGLIERP